MAKSFAELKKSRNKSFEELAQKAKDIADGKGYGADERIWLPTVDKTGNGYAVIRFLPEAQGENFPYVTYYDHGFQGPTGLWYIEKSLTSIGKDDPMSEYNSKLWNTGIEANKEIVRKQKRRLHYISNVYVVSDPSNPDNEGKVFLYIYGKKIFDKLNEEMNPQFEDETPVNPFDFWEGANFKLKIRKVEGYRNYDKSEFDKPSTLFEDDNDMERVYESLHPLQAFVDPSNFKSYDELKEKMERVLCLTDEESAAEPRSFKETSPTRNEIKSHVKPEPMVSKDASNDDDLDDDYFRKLIE